MKAKRFNPTNCPRKEGMEGAPCPPAPRCCPTQVPRRGFPLWCVPHALASNPDSFLTYEPECQHSEGRDFVPVAHYCVSEQYVALSDK